MWCCVVWCGVVWCGVEWVKHLDVGNSGKRSSGSSTHGGGGEDCEKAYGHPRWGRLYVDPEGHLGMGGVGVVGVGKKLGGSVGE